MSEIVFFFKQSEILIQCSEDEKLKDIFMRFSSKVKVDYNNMIFIHNGSKINEDLSYKEFVNNFNLNKNADKINILVHTKNNKKEIICPTCKQSCLMKIKDYTISLYGCKNNHTHNNIMLNDLENILNMNELKIKCNNCDMTKYKPYNKFFKCLTCGQNLCNLCNTIHNKSHQTIDYDKRNYFCNIHKSKYISYCDRCKINLCSICNKEHNNNHSRVYFVNMSEDISDLKKKMNEFKRKIDKLNDKIKQIISILNNTIDNINIIYEINYELINHFDGENKNYETLKNINEIKNIINIQDFDEIINEKNITNNFISLMKIYCKMKMKDDINSDDNLKLKNESINEITIRYKINENENRIKIFGNEFVENNKNHCKIIYNEKEYELTKYFEFENNANEDILEIKLEGIKNIINMSCMFLDCPSLISLSDLDKWNTSNITNMSSVFNNNVSGSSLISLPDISKWDTSNVIDMSFMFQNCSLLSSLPDISRWNTSNVKNMISMFYGCSSLISLPDISKWKTSNLTYMKSMFSGCKSIIKLPDLTKWDTSNVTNLSHLFQNCSSLESMPDISKWNTSNVTDMNNIFHNCSALAYLPDISKWDVCNVTNMSSMFQKCSSLILLPDLSKWNTSKVTTMRCIFYGCSSLSTIFDISKWNTSNVINMENMFFGCKSLAFPPNISKLDISKVTNMCCMFKDCLSLPLLLDISNLVNNSVNTRHILQGCINIVKIPPKFKE